MATAHFNIGSNIGDRLALIGRAVALLEAKTGATANVSAPVFSAPWGYQSPNEFVNVGVSIHTDLRPDALLAIALGVEREIAPDCSHRTDAGDYADRMIDIDLICLDDKVCEADPVIPHPRMHLREFVLIPMVELMPRWVHPLSGKTAGQLLDGLHNKSS